MTLSNINKTHDVERMDYYYYNFGTRAKMYEIYKQLHKLDTVPDYLINCKILAPAERESGFASALDA